MTGQKNEKVGICIPTYNQAAYIEISVRSALNQIGPFDVEVWVSDDASTDNTPDVMKKLCSEDDRVRYFRQPKNIGMAENRSWALSQPNTEFVVNLDSDDILKPEFLLNLVPKLHQYPEAGYAHAATEFIDKSGTPTSVRKLFRHLEYVEPETALKESVKGIKTTCITVLFRKRALEDVNYTRNLHKNGQDFDLTVKIADFGYGNVYVNKILSQYRTWYNNRHNSASRIIALLKTYNETITPAFQKRNWDLGAIIKQKKKLAVSHSIVLITNTLLSAQEKKEITNLLITLGNSPSLKLRLFLYKLGLGNFFLIKRNFVIYLKNKIKNLLMRNRSSIET